MNYDSDRIEDDEHWYGKGTGPIHFTGVDCIGYEESIEDCMDVTDTRFSDTFSCSHASDVGIKCADKTGKICLTIQAPEAEWLRQSCKPEIPSSNLRQFFTNGETVKM